MVTIWRTYAKRFGRHGGWLAKGTGTLSVGPYEARLEYRQQINERYRVTLVLGNETVEATYSEGGKEYEWAQEPSETALIKMRLYLQVADLDHEESNDG
jgi:hypothetical protein